MVFYFSFLFFLPGVVVDELGFKAGCALLELEFDNLILKLDLSKTTHLSSLQLCSQVINLPPTFKEHLQTLSLFLANTMGPHILKPPLFLTNSFITPSKINSPFELGLLLNNHQLPRALLRLESESPTSPLWLFFSKFPQVGTRDKLAKWYKFQKKKLLLLFLTVHKNFISS